MLKKSNIVLAINIFFGLIYMGIYLLFIIFLIYLIKNKKFFYFFTIIIFIAYILLPSFIGGGGNRMRLPVEGMIILPALYMLKKIIFSYIIKRKKFNNYKKILGL